MPTERTDERDTKAVELSIDDAIRRVRQALEGLRYGEVVVKVQNGKPIWVDKHERERVG